MVATGALLEREETTAVTATRCEEADALERLLGVQLAHSGAEKRYDPQTCAALAGQALNLAALVDAGKLETGAMMAAVTVLRHVRRFMLDLRVYHAGERLVPGALDYALDGVTYFTYNWDGLIGPL